MSETQNYTRSTEDKTQLVHSNIISTSITATATETPLPSNGTAANTTTTTTSLNSTSSKILKPKKKSKKLCNYKSCLSPHSIIGDCQFCFKKFCGKHRLLESHDCEHYREVQKDYHDRNARKLEAQQTIMSKV
ncbi:hypothetical protein WICPIJ_002377 [Wickerhamomyces pijperi]|uniref:AN1-type domain-containing protein n=1 Tax=Wickerhamomyces pijperi TaxID=599730 RepID=A0A9P8Q926_WICPI|nr:hypothetical protein WICPIJ_002377 [Wickerhamomyces pijperi]